MNGGGTRSSGGADGALGAPAPVWAERCECQSGPQSVESNEIRHDRDRHGELVETKGTGRSSGRSAERVHEPEAVRNPDELARRGP